MKTARISSVIKGREDTTSKKVESVEVWFGGEIDHRSCDGKGAVVVEKGKREGSTQGNTQEERLPQSYCLGKVGLIFCEFLQPEGLKDWSFKDWWAWLR